MRLLAAFLFYLACATGAAACGPETDCVLGERHYRIALPEGHDGTSALPAIVFAHGFRGSAAGVMRNGSLRRMASDLGAALIAPKSDGPGWELPNGPRSLDSTGAAEFAFFDAMLVDAAARFPIDRARIMATGFSAGGMMVWNLACARPDAFAGFAPISGTFWLAPPETCAVPVTSIIHIHGTTDKTVPLTGRVIGPTKQGEVADAIAMYADFGDFAEPAPGGTYGALTCEARANAQDHMLKLCLFEGGHSFRTEFVRFAWEQLKEAGRL